MKPDINRINKTITEAVGSARHFCQVAVDGNEVKGVLLAVVTPNVWAQRMCAGIVLWVSAIPGEGARMLRAFRDWVISRRGIRVAGLAHDTELDPRVFKLLELVGFKRAGSCYLFYNRGLSHGTI